MRDITSTIVKKWYSSSPVVNKPIGFFADANIPLRWSNNTDIDWENNAKFVVCKKLENGTFVEVDYILIKLLRVASNKFECQITFSDGDFKGTFKVKVSAELNKDEQYVYNTINNSHLTVDV